MRLLSSIWFKDNRDCLAWQENTKPDIQEIRLVPVVRPSTEKVDWYVTATYFIEREEKLTTEEQK